MSQSIVRILDVPFINTTHRAFIDLLVERALESKKTFVVTANPEIVMHAQQDDVYKEVLEHVDFVTADGIGIIKAAQYIGQPLPERVSGYDIMMDLLKEADQRNQKVFLLGASESSNAKATERILANFPGIDLVGSQHGYFDWNDNSIAERVQQSQPDFVFVALGFPLQELWIHQNLHLFEKGIFIGVGGSFDVIAGHVQRAPEFWRRLNIEWLYRLLKQPTRWKRMLVLPKFVWTMLRKRQQHKIK